MKSENLIKSEIDKVRNNETKLYSYLYDLIYNEESKNANFLEKVFSTFINDERDEIKRIAIYGLLFGLKIKNDIYKNIAVKELGNTYADFDLRLTSLSSVSEAYKGSKDEKLLALFFKIFNSDEEDEDLRTQSFIGMMKLLGMSSLEITKVNNNKVIVGIEDINLSEFSDEILKVKSLISYV